MENSFQTSFIPKKPVVSNFSDKIARSPLSLIATFFLVVSILISAGLFLYKSYLTKQKESFSQSLTTARNSFEKETIEELAMFDKRIQSANKILDNHIVLSPLFSLLGEVTVPSIQYTSFNHQSDTGTFVVEMEGIAKDYRSIILQAEAFNSLEGRSFENVLFYNLNKNKDNNVTFDLKFNVKPDILSYRQSQVSLLNEVPVNNVVLPENSSLPDINNETQ